ncbi:SNF2 superfamily protein [Mycena pura]|uniref:SNF2 superfamily protein n=1 Tax=Mycena pura TaxID=153505 RepID=A0AAD6XYL8_9AGAR|nr:SNF2 superfamily protein [Mycena pura]
MAQTSPSALLALARTHLSLTPTANVPPRYVEALEQHLALYPHDTLFRVVLTAPPKAGYGAVICLEEGCGSVPIARSRVPDPEGCLAAYRIHIQCHSTHVQSRQARLASSGATGVDAALSWRQVVRKASVLTPSLTLSARIKPEPVEATIPRKRLSNSFNDLQVSKKPKHEENLDPNTSVVKAEVVPAPLPSIDVEEVRAKIMSAQKEISHKQALYDRMQRKKNKSKADKTRMTHLYDALVHLRTLKAEYDASLPRAMSPVKRTASLVKTESLTKLPPHPYYNPAAGKFKAEPLNVSFPRIPDGARSNPKLIGVDALAPEDYKPTFPKTEHINEPFSVSPVPNSRPVIQRTHAAVSGSRFPGAYASASDDEMDADPVVTLNKVLHAIPAIAPLGGQDHRDDNGDFHGRGRDMFQGPQAKADDIDRFLIDAGNAELFDGNATIDGALVKLGLESTHELLPSLDVPMMPHQLLGVAWMVDNERKKSLQGGLLADEMGLGKVIATMAKNPSQDPSCKTTLILAPLALLVQWTQEIASKINANWKVLIYHGTNKVKKKADLLQYDVVLTTYSTMALEWLDREADVVKKKRAKTKKPVDNFIISDSDDSDSDLDLPKTKRKGKKEWASRAVTELSSKLRWCLTATPIVNGVVDVYGSLRFLKIRPWYDWTEFNHHVARLEKKQPQLAVTRLQTILGLFVLRRTKTSKLDGKRLIELPEKTVELVSLQFGQEERDIYTQVETAQQAKFNRYLRAGTVLKNYASVLVLLLRLRQLCSHPALIQEGGSYFLAPDEVDDPEEYREELANARALVSSEFVKKMKAKFKDLALRRIQAEKESVDAVVEVDDCPICFDALSAAVVTACGHEFCRDCIENFLQTPSIENDGLKGNERACPTCRSAICAEKLFTTAAFEPTDEELAKDDEDGEDSDVETVDFKPVRQTSKSKGKAKANRPARKSTARKIILDSSDIDQESATENDNYTDGDSDSDLSDFIVETDEDEEEKDARRLQKKSLGKRRAIIVVDSDEEDNVETPEEKEVLFGAKKKLTKQEIKTMPRFLPSTKMKAMMDYLKKLALERPDEKTLVVSQWTGCLNIVSDYLTETGIVHVKYQGDMSSAKRDQAVQVFMSKDKARVMLMSSKCGGVGLNLTRANNVISLDLGWSLAMDQQAFDRVHRLGQNRKVLVRRLVIENTVEDRILALQERKQNLADGALGEGKGKKVGRLSVRELANLFGLDARGRVVAKD